MRQSIVTLIALTLSVSIWPPLRSLAAIAHAPDAHATLAFTGARPLVQLAKHNDDEQDYEDEDEEAQHRHHKHEGEAREEEQQRFCGPYFKSDYVPYFRNYYSQNDYENLPPGLRKHVQKTGHLPPGLEKKYRRTGHLPPGLQKRFECGQTLPPDYVNDLYPVPDVAYRRVGPLPPDSTLYLYGNDLILLNDHTKAIIDLLHGAY